MRFGKVSPKVNFSQEFCSAVARRLKTSIFYKLCISEYFVGF